MEIRPTTRQDSDAIWNVLEPALRAGDTYALPRDIPRDAALDWFFSDGNRPFVAEDSGRVLGAYYYRTNAKGGAGHVANAAFVTNPEARGRGAASAMCEHALAAARAEGFRAMQFNFVVSTNPAVRLWQSLGFAIVGTLPGAFDHPALGEVDAYVMHRSL
jgi:L-amino acid N-acyltransferase YncA